VTVVTVVTNRAGVRALVRLRLSTCEDFA
jgi:hypothetical protein